MNIYKDCDIRGKAYADLTESAAFDIGCALAEMTNAAQFVVGGDNRLSTEDLKNALIRGLTTGGCAVIDIGTTPTPVFYFALKRLGIKTGVMTTGSHNPPEYNGFKIALGDLPVTPAQIQRLKSLSERRRFKTNSGSVIVQNVYGDYAEWIESAFSKPFKPLKVVVDAGNGAYSDIAPEILARLGFRAVPLFCEMDGGFPNRSPNPASPENLTALSEMVVDCKADFGVAFDCDGDRAAFCDEEGQIIPADVVIAMLTSAIAKSNPGRAFVFDIKCSRITHLAAETAGCVPLMEKSGHTFIKTRMIKEKAIFGGEASGHFFYEELDGGDDGLYSAIRFAELISHSNMPLSSAWRAVPQFVTLPDIRLPFAGDPESVFSAIKAALNSDAKIIAIDGIRAEFKSGWFLVRASVTEPLLTFRIEAYDANALPTLMEPILKALPHDLQAALLSAVQKYQ